MMYAYGKTVPLTEIAEKCGYTDYVYFLKKFKSITGVAPRTYMADTFGYSNTSPFRENRDVFVEY